MDHSTVSKAKSLFAAKAAIEGDPSFMVEDNDILVRYLELLLRINREVVGVVHCRWPTVPHPLYFRAGSSDLSNFIQIFHGREYGFRILCQPRRILDLGGYVGYAAVYLATRFPDAKIISVEPSDDNFLLHTMNTIAYGNIARLNGAVWGESSSLSVDEFNGGDWGTHLTESTSGTCIRAYSIKEILDKYGWADFDFLKCDIEGSEVSLFERSGAEIAGVVLCCAIETHDALDPRSSETVAKSFRSDLFSHSRSGEFDIFQRREKRDRTITPSAIHLMRPSVGANPIQLVDVPEQSWGYYTFGGNCLQLHPGNASAEASQFRSHLSVAGHGSFEAGLSVSNPLGFAVDFTFVLENLDEENILSETICISPGESRSWRVLLPQLHGEYVVGLLTRMATGVPTNHQASAKWIDPRFL